MFLLFSHNLIHLKLIDSQVCLQKHHKGQNIFLNPSLSRSDVLYLFENNVKLLKALMPSKNDR